MEYSLLVKRLKKGLNPKEEKQFQEWYFSSPDHRVYYENLKNNFHDSRDLKINTSKAWEKVDKKIVKAKNNYWKYVIAAIVVVGFLSFPIYFFLSTPLEQKNKVVNVNELESPSEGVIFKDQNGNSVTFGKNDSVVSGKYYQGSKNQLKIAKVSEAVGINTIIVPTGKQFNIELSDGTKVTLNAKSKLEFPTSFSESDHRKINLIYGEAYFEVTPASENNDKKFIVENSNQNIEVIGTSFNIENYNEGEIVTTLVEGKINLLYGKDKTVMTPGQQSTVKNQNLEAIKKVEVYDYVAWKDGMFLFKDKSLEDIFNVLSRWYDIEVEFEQKTLQEIKFNGRFKQQQKLKNILHIIENTKRARFELNGNKIKVMQYQE
ncbi:FecR family protein [Salegentibacter holothuriorum]|uniref:FecR family protein n=1 Tax=Salegentibacter holothuriorum TaxID=241145 RepID=A0A1T5E919_9FLAO|nr:FecR family protein [Salegentibacter holothuriorum]SKB80346.1 FecR family protein [Salegentibacter holothuriorum]